MSQISGKDPRGHRVKGAPLRSRFFSREKNSTGKKFPSAVRLTVRVAAFTTRPATEPKTDPLRFRRCARQPNPRSAHPRRCGASVDNGEHIHAAIITPPTRTFRRRNGQRRNGQRTNGRRATVPDVPPGVLSGRQSHRPTVPAWWTRDYERQQLPRCGSTDLVLLSGHNNE